jgi:hypothetical protein
VWEAKEMSGFLGVVSILLLALLLPRPATAESYREATVSNGGALKGKITFSGTVPPPQVFKISNFPDQDFCKKVSDGKGNRIIQPVQVGKGGGLENVVVVIENLHSGKPFHFDGTQVNVEHCEFLVQGGSSVLSGVMVNRTNFRVLNLDSNPANPKEVMGVTHNPQGFEIEGKQKRMMFNFLIATKGQNSKRTVKLNRMDGYVSVVCNIHDYMRVYFLPVDNPYYSIVGHGGTYSIDQIPPGKYKVTAWNPALGRIRKEVDVLPGKTAELDFNFKD